MSYCPHGLSLRKLYCLPGKVPPPPPRLSFSPPSRCATAPVLAINCLSMSSTAPLHCFTAPAIRTAPVSLPQFFSHASPHQHLTPVCVLAARLFLLLPLSTLLRSITLLFQVTHTVCTQCAFIFRLIFSYVHFIMSCSLFLLLHASGR